MPSPKTKLIAIVISLLSFVPAITAFASSTDGTILSTYQYAWSNNSGWVNFGLASGNVHVKDDKLTGYAWTANDGWINLRPTLGGVTNTSQGTLGGWAWGESLGWINFTGVTIDSNGRFRGHVTGDVAGIITFDCGYCDVRTDWRPTAVSGGGGGVSTPSPSPAPQPAPVEIPPATQPPTPPATEPSIPPPTEPSSPPAPAPSPAVPSSGPSGSQTDSGSGGASGGGSASEKQPPTNCAVYPQDPQCAGLASDFCILHPTDPKCSVGQIVKSAIAKLPVQKIRQNLRNALASPAAQTANGVVALVAAPAIVVAQASVFSLGLGSLSELWLVLVRIFQNLLVVLGFRRKRRYWGTVYDSASKQPLDPVIVELLDAQTGRKVEQAITDMSGRFGFLTEEGTFRIAVQKTHYRFPAQNVSGASDQIFTNLYYGETFSLSQSEVVAPNIPMDPMAADWNQTDKQRIIKFHPHREWFIYLLFNALFYLGCFWTVLTVYLSPSWFNFLCLSVYMLVLIIRLLLPTERLWGRVYDTKTGLAVTRADLELTLPGMPTVLLGRAKSGLDGKFFLKAQPGTYCLTVYSPSTQGTRTSLGQVDVTIGKHGILHSDIGL